MTKAPLAALFLLLSLALGAPVQAGSYLSGEGYHVRTLPLSGQLEVTAGPSNRGAAAYYCAAAQAARARMGAEGTDRLRIEGMPRGGTGALFTLLRDVPRDPGFRILARRGTTLSVAASTALCKA